MPADGDHADLGPVLSRALRMLRRRRGLTVAQMAARLGLPQRTYEYFEAAEGELKLDRLHAAAEAMSADPYAVLLGVEIGSAELAVRCADNKLVMILVQALEEFDARARDAIALLDPQTVMSAFGRVFGELAALAEARARIARSGGPPRKPDRGNKPKERSGARGRRGAGRQVGVPEAEDPGAPKPK